jgi:hypothetical protein
MPGKITFLIFAVTLLSCKELYEDYQPELTEEFLVVEGMITNDPGPYNVTISKAMAYRNDLDLNHYKPDPETNATVKIITDKGEEVVLYELESQPGTYSTKKEELTGEISHSYGLYIKTQKGEIYESLPSVLLEHPDISNLYAAASQKTYLDESIPGNTNYVTKSGFQLTCDVAGTGIAKYTKINTRIMSEFSYYSDSSFYYFYFFRGNKTRIRVYSKTDSLYCLNLCAADPSPNIVGMGNITGASVVRNVPLGFNIVYDLPENDTSITSGFLASLNVNDDYFSYDSLVVIRIISQNHVFVADINAYYIDDAVYEYYRNVKNQVTANNKIFDPIPLQLTGNIKCTSNPGKNIFGIFTVASVARRRFHINYYGDYCIPVVEKINDYEPVKYNSCTTERPSFWKSYRKK